MLPFWINKRSVAVLCVHAGKQLNVSLQAMTLVLMFGVSNMAQADDTFTMAFGGDPATEPQYLFYSRLYSALFEELGYEFDYVVCPSKRCSEEANKGEVDGEPQRIASYGERYKNMLRVEETVFVNRNIAFASDSAISIDGLADLKNSHYRIDYLRGSVWSEMNLGAVVVPEQLNEVATADQALKRLLRGRTDLFVDLEATVMRLIHRSDFKGAAVVPVGILASNHSYPFVHKSHVELAPRIATLLCQMKADGRYEELLRQSMPFMFLEPLKAVDSKVIAPAQCDYRKTEVDGSDLDHSLGAKEEL